MTKSYPKSKMDSVFFSFIEKQGQGSYAKSTGRATGKSHCHPHPSLNPSNNLKQWDSDYLIRIIKHMWSLLQPLPKSLSCFEENKWGPKWLEIGIWMKEKGFYHIEQNIMSRCDARLLFYCTMQFVSLLKYLNPMNYVSTYLSEKIFLKLLTIYERSCNSKLFK